MKFEFFSFSHGCTVPIICTMYVVGLDAWTYRSPEVLKRVWYAIQSVSGERVEKAVMNDEERV